MAIEGGSWDPSKTIPGGGGPATNLAAGSSSYGQGPQVTLYIGRSKKPKTPSDPKEAKLYGDAYATSSHEIRRSPGQLLAEFDQLTRKEFLKFRNLLIAAGYVSETADALTVREAYQVLLQETYDLQNAGRPTLTPSSLLNNLIRMNGLDPKKIGDSEDFMSATEAAVPRTTTQTTVYDLTPEDARATLEQAMTQKLGRAPSAEEVEDFIAAAQTRAERNPTRVTETFTPGTAGGSGDQVSVTREGGEVATTVTNIDEGFDDASLARMAERRAKNAPDYASYQAVSQYFPAFLQALGSTV